MQDIVCPKCNNQLYGYKNNSRRFNKKSKKIIKERPVRTSTPISEYENRHIPSFSDSVADFFYQSWKSGLNSEGTINSQVQVDSCCHVCTALQPVCYPTQIVYVNTVILQPYTPVVGLYSVAVGYRPDGTFGVLPMYWPSGYFKC